MMDTLQQSFVAQSSSLAIGRNHTSVTCSAYSFHIKQENDVSYKNFNIYLLYLNIGTLHGGWFIGQTIHIRVIHTENHFKKCYVVFYVKSRNSGAINIFLLVDCYMVPFLKHPPFVCVRSAKKIQHSSWMIVKTSIESHTGIGTPFTIVANVLARFSELERCFVF